MRVAISKLRAEARILVQYYFIFAMVKVSVILPVQWQQSQSFGLVNIHHIQIHDLQVLLLLLPLLLHRQ